MDPSAIDERAAPRPRADLAAVEIDGELVVHDPLDDSVRHLGPAATVVWRCLDGRATIAELADDVVAVLGGERRGATGDLLRIVRGFERAGLLAAAREPSAAEGGVASALVPVPPDE